MRNFEEEFCTPEELAAADAEQAARSKRKAPPPNGDGAGGGPRPFAPIEDEERQGSSGPVIDTSAPYDVARLFQAQLATPARYHRGGFYEWNGSSWPECGEDKLRARLYEFLDGCLSKAKGGACRVMPNPRMVSAMLDALRAAAYLDETIAPPSWLDGVNGLPAHEIVACSNGLLHLLTLKLLPHTRTFCKKLVVQFASLERRTSPASFIDVSLILRCLRVALTRG